jgi:MSHA biogenesis protein MshO
MVAVFIKSPVQAYFDTARRAEMTDAADTAVRRMSRDIQNALPNSVRVNGTNFLEFIPVLGAGRYCPDVGLAAPAWVPPQTPCTDALNFGVPDMTFFALAPFPLMNAGDSIVVYNQPDPAPNAYAGTNRAAFTALAGNIVTMAATTFPLASPNNRFHVIATPVTYECAPNLATPALGQLRRYSNYAIQAAQPTPPAVAPAVLATNVAECTLTFNAGLMASAGLVNIRLRLESVSPGGIPESVVLQHQVNVNNAP